MRFSNDDVQRRICVYVSRALQESRHETSFIFLRAVSYAIGMSESACATDYPRAVKIFRFSFTRHFFRLVLKFIRTPRFLNS